MNMKSMFTWGVLALALNGGTAIAGRDHGATFDTFPVQWTITHASCPNVPNGVVINGSGTENSITTTTTVKGITTIINSSHATGTASDNRGNTYGWNYSNHFRAENTLADPGVFSGEMVDAFSMAGSGGPYGLSNGFKAIYTFSSDGSFYSIVEITSRGDPVVFGDFATNACDPL